MKIGFTGTRNGMTHKQSVAFQKTVGDLVKNLSSANYFHHGDCVGADAEAHIIAPAFPNIIPVIHPPIDETHRAFCIAQDIRPAKSHFARNRDIVNETDILVACPPYMTPIVKETLGGTAYTVNYARNRGKPVVICWPDGTCTRETAWADGMVTNTTDFSKKS